MMYQRWQKRDPVKYYFMVPNEVFSLGLNSSELSIYSYLLRCEDRKDLPVPSQLPHHRQCGGSE